MPGEHFEIARASRSQMAEVARVFKVSRRQALPFLPEIHSAEEDADHFTKVVFPGNEVHVAIAANGQIVGFIAFADGWVNHLYLLPEVQGRGLGQRLLAIAQEKCPQLDLWTFQRNIHAQNFYLQQGFRQVESTDGNANEEREPDVLLRWKR